ncbi:12868_t:CDS:2 [Acaulospora morrowiae]|uniref:12868_t:CDS:1 n=1 Tax=Acaulospora morrowiae TaxID=94023 RepID=A0A9N9FHJ3_9GLOM|nr:12868_t:CDS:2 [Acaulospora morrowiae]
MIFYADLGEDFKQLYENRENCDVKIYAGEKLEELQTHSLLLRARSPYFSGALSQECTKDQHGYFIFRFPTISASTFEVILRYICCGIIDLHELHGTEILKVLIPADELGLQKFIIYVQKFLIENRVDFLREDPGRILQTITYHEAFDDLKKFCLDTILADPVIIFGSNKFLTLEENVLLPIFKCDELSMDEIEIWNCVIKWGIAQDLELKDNVENYKDQDFKALEEKIQNFIPLIRFHEISMGDFYFRVWPFEKILPEELVDDILRCYMVSKATPRFNAYPSRISFSSTLIDKKHLILFASWIDQKSENYTKFEQIPYEFPVIYRASRDGNKSIMFRQKCNNQGATIVVGKIQNSEMFVGGYNPLSWTGNDQYSCSSESFIFSINNDDNCLGRLNECDNYNNCSLDYDDYCDDYDSYFNYNNETYEYDQSNWAIYDHTSYGPTFGKGHDLCCRFDSWISNPDTYWSIGLPNQYCVSDWEVFKVVKKG